MTEQRSVYHTPNGDTNPFVDPESRRGIEHKPLHPLEQAPSLASVAGVGIPELITSEHFPNIPKATLQEFLMLALQSKMQRLGAFLTEYTPSDERAAIAREMAELNNQIIALRDERFGTKGVVTSLSSDVISSPSDLSFVDPDSATERTVFVPETKGEPSVGQYL